LQVLLLAATPRRIIAALLYFIFSSLIAAESRDRAGSTVETSAGTLAADGKQTPNDQYFHKSNFSW
jgi:hypothetical protein